MDFRNLWARFTAFVNDFLPESNLQLLFPLASFLLFVGASTPWLPPGHVSFSPEYQSAGRSAQDLWFDISSPLLLFRYNLALCIATFAIFASVVLWCLPVRNTARKFAAWVFVPLGVALAYFLLLVLIGRCTTPSILAPSSQIFVEQLRAFPARLTHLGIGFYITLLGGVALGFCVREFRVGKINLPLRFRDQAPVSGVEAAPDLGRRVFVFLAVSLLCSFVVMLAILRAPPRISSWPRGLSILEWGPPFFTAFLIAVCAAVLLKDNQEKPLPRKSRTLFVRDLVLAFLLGVLLVCLPRVVSNMIQGVPMFAIEYASGLPIAILGVDVPQPFFWLLIVYPIAALHEIVLRGRLQAQLARRFGLKRSIFLVALLWWILGLGYGIEPIAGPRLFIPGTGALFFILLYAVYSVPLGWLYARMNSVLPPTVMLGTILLFHEGGGIPAYVTHPAFYWIELALLALTGWVLFKRYPPTETGRASA
jgi:membrane protease YdiL (CAAX protease family)